MREDHITSQGDDLASALQVKCAISYIRVSTREQAERDDRAEGFSIPAQREAIRYKAKNIGALIVKEFVERGRTGTNNNRPALQKMLAYIQATPGIDFVIVHKIDRLARTLVGDVDIGKILSAAGVQLVSTTENIDESPSGRLIHGVMSVIAEFYSRNLSTEVLKGMRQKARRSGTLGRAPLGYLNRRAIDEHGREVRDVILDPLRSPLVREAFRLYATGAWALSQLDSHLTSQGLTSRATTHQFSRPMTASRLQAIFTNPYYKGLVRYEGVSYQGVHPPLVSTAIWQLIQTILTSRRNGERIRKHPHFLISSLYCERCGARMHVHDAHSARNRTYPYFICSGRTNPAHSCTMPAVRIDQVERAVEGSYRQIQLPADIKAMLQHHDTSQPLWRIYRQAPPAAKRLLNQALFVRVVVDRSVD